MCLKTGNFLSFAHAKSHEEERLTCKFDPIYKGQTLQPKVCISDAPIGERTESQANLEVRNTQASSHRSDRTATQRGPKRISMPRTWDHCLG